MKDINQVRIILKALINEKSKFLFELAKLDSLIQKKTIGLKQMLNYQQEYQSEKNFQLTRLTPILHKNLNSFTKKISDIIFHEDNEIKRLNDIRSTLLKKINELSQKIKVMSSFEAQIKIEDLMHIEKNEQSMIDDLSAIKFTRDENE